MDELWMPSLPMSVIAFESLLTLQMYNAKEDQLAQRLQITICLIQKWQRISEQIF